ncbi:OsmC family protein [Haloarcula nitratireducens]|uniref:OsmC family protein n=1 Tax=Haloarcula nitratireducens TaxID=2487749 RepID=A0AAW4PFU1_9EURY|nr:OsmC family protein [Halomicroarcula nitratireducens]MBX0296829.1 OsmC family protein [Halomicroarcula nitratireducens]
MAADQQVTHGVDLETLEEFAEFAGENPDEVQLGLGARSTYEGTCAHSLAKVDSYELGGETIARETREYTIPYGAWKEVLDAGGWVGGTDRLEPIEAALSALASCINVGITVNAVASGVDIEYLQTRIRTEFDPRVLFSLKDLGEADTVFENLTAEVEIESPDLDKDQIDEWARRAPVYTLVSLAQDVQLTVTTPAEVAADD